MWPNGVVAMVVSAAVLLSVCVAAGCAPLTFYNALAPADGAARLTQADVPYGGDPRQTLDVYTPAPRPGASPARAPIVVVIYGGSWNSGRRQDYAFLGKALASRGFVAIVADYRLVPTVRFPAFLEDNARAVVWAHAHAADFGGDPDRLYLLGHSAGAYNAVMIALDRRYLTDAGASPAILKGVAALSGPYDFLPLDVASTQAAFGGARDLRATQPINFVSSDAPAMFLATGEDDTTVKPRNTRILAQKMAEVHASVVMRTYPGIGHIGILMALSVPFRSRASVLDDVVQFIASHP